MSPFLRKNFEPSDSSPESRVICYCNEAVGIGLGFSLAPARMGIFSDNTGESEGQTNAGYLFSKRANKGANQFKLLLRPGTEIEVTYSHPETFNQTTTKFPKRSVSLSFDKSVSVTEVKLWLAGAANEKIGLMQDVYAVVAPSLKVHPLGSKSDPSRNIPVTNEMTSKAAQLGIRLVVL